MKAVAPTGLSETAKRADLAKLGAMDLADLARNHVFRVQPAPICIQL